VVLRQSGNFLQISYNFWLKSLKHLVSLCPGSDIFRNGEIFSRPESVLSGMIIFVHQANMVDSNKQKQYANYSTDKKRSKLTSNLETRCPIKRSQSTLDNTLQFQYF